MTEPTIVQLHTIFEDIDQVTALARVLKRRALEETFTAGERPGGGRLSIDDPVRRVKAIFDDFWTLPIKDEIGRRGYLCEDLLEVGVIMATTGAYAHVDEYDVQVAIPWGPEGEGWQSAFDFVLAGGRVVSCKSVFTNTPVEKLKPSSANLAQERRMMALAGKPAGAKFDVWMVHPGALAARGPFTHELRQEDIDAARAEAEAVARAWDHFRRAPKNTYGERDPKLLPEWNDPAWWERLGLVSTTGAFRVERLDACGAIENRNRRFVRLRQDRLDAARAEEEAKEALFPFVREQIELKRQTDPLAKSVTAYSGDSLVTYTLRKDGAIVTTVKPLDPPAAADAAA